MTRQELIAALEAATEPSMGLSREIARHFGWINRGNARKGEWFRPSDTRDGEPVLDSLHGTDVYREPPHFSASLDAAVTLVPEGANCHGYDYDPVNGYTAYWSRNYVSDRCTWIREGHHKTSGPIAYCIAALRAMEDK